jgi:hypothetical protein
MKNWLRVIAAGGPLREGASGVGSELESLRYLAMLKREVLQPRP